MRHGNSSRRQRGRSNGARRGGQQRSRVYDSNGPDVRIRGTAHQVADKYMNLAKDATSSGDTITAESYLQHAEHYQRIINSWEESIEENREHIKRTAQHNSQNNSGDEEGDLSLPSSILGSSSKPNSYQNQERTGDLVES